MFRFFNFFSFIVIVFFFFFFFFFNDTATTEIYTLSLHDALPISRSPMDRPRAGPKTSFPGCPSSGPPGAARSEEHTSELQSQFHLVCRLLLEKKKNKQSQHQVTKKKKKKKKN